MSQHQQSFTGEAVVSSSIGLRSWEIHFAREQCKSWFCKVMIGNPVLHGMYGHAWSTGENFAECKRCETTAVDCTCGFYAYWDLNDMLKAHAYYRVVGVIEGFGNLTIGTLGFRCQKARILALNVPPSYIGLRLDRTYADTPIFTNIDIMLAEFPTRKGIG